MSGEFELPESFTSETAEYLLEEIFKIYDFIDSVLLEASREDLTDKELMLEMVSPFTAAVLNSMDIFLRLYTEVITRKTPITLELQEKFEGAFNDIFYAYKEFLDISEEKLAMEKWDE